MDERRGQWDCPIKKRRKRGIKTKKQKPSGDLKARGHGIEGDEKTESNSVNIYRKIRGALTTDWARDKNRRGESNNVEA